MSFKLQAYMKSKIGHWKKWVENNDETHTKRVAESIASYNTLLHIKRELEQCTKSYVNDPIMLEFISKQIKTNESSLRQYNDRGVRHYVISDRERNIELACIVEAAVEAMENNDYAMFNIIAKQIEDGSY